MWTIKWTFVLIFGGFVGFVMSQEFADQSSDFLDKRNNENDTGLDNAESLPELYEPFQENFEDNPANKGELDSFELAVQSYDNIKYTTDRQSTAQRSGMSNEVPGRARTATKPCPVRPKVINAQMSCTSVVCKITCLKDYEFPGGNNLIQVDCINGTWNIHNSNLKEIPSCEPVCNPSCQNNGICMSPGVCDCPENFMGTQCQMEKKLCLKAPPMPANSKRACTKTTCSVNCNKGFRFPDASTAMNMECRNGEWAPSNQALVAIPDCEASCNPQCLNGGNCLSYNVCQCPPNYRGPQCQYNTNVCAPRKLHFNGGYNCSGSGVVLECKVYCPQGIKFEFEPAEKYSCNYAVGSFEPAGVPQCVYDPGMSVVVYNETQGHNETKLQKPGVRNQSASKAEHQEEEESEEEIEEIVVTKKKVKKPKKEQTFYDEIGEIDGVDVFYSVQGGINVFITPKPTMCITFNGNKFKTFDGLIYSYELYCSHTLLQDYIDGTFKIVLRSCPYGSVQPCPHALEIFLQSEQYTIEKVDGRVKLFTTTKEIPIPVQISGLKVSRSGVEVRIVMDAIPLTIIWDTEHLVQVEATPSIWNRTSGICGTIDGDISNDFTAKDGTIHKMPSTFVESWKVLALDKDKQKCSRQPKSEDLALSCQTSIEEKADMVCADLLSNPKLSNCMKKFNKETLLKNCKSDYCDCTNKEQRAKCSCKGIAVVVKDCQFQGVMLENGWRDWEICPLVCTNGRIFKPCGPIHESYCGSAIEDNSLDCREGCFCPEGTILHENQCIKQEQCPCKLNGKVFAAKAQITRDCNTCTCQNGNWKCTSITCGSRCAAVGDPHYTTFDGKRFDFMGKCSYYLLKTEGICVEAENVACSGAISQNMNMLPAFASESPSCTKSVTIKFQDEGKERTIKLKQGGVVVIDGYELLLLPKDLMNGLIKIRQASSSFVLVDFKIGIKVWWDGITRVYIDADASFRGKTKGLCGTFNSNVKDDFLTPEGDIESAISLFADKWKTKESCEFPLNNEPLHPCQKNPENKLKAEKICSKIRGQAFNDCHWLVDNEPFYQDCLYDVCACNSQIIGTCACPILASYASECSRQGSVLNWRYKVEECAVTCPIGQIFYQCGDACARTCSDIARGLPCKLQCVEGCRCPEGQILDDKTNECVPVSTCKCIFKNLEFNPGYKEVRAGQRFQELCSCSAAKWNCVEAKPGDADKYPSADSLVSRCSPARNEEFSTCEPADPVTCKNMHQEVGTSPADCRPGCVCKKGYVLDVAQKSCVLPEKCSCHHGGKSYNEGQTMREDCNTCNCQGGKWKCTDKPCFSTCSVWGDGHFSTFDGLDYDFHGVCSYLLSKGKLSDGNGYSVTIQNVLCGSKGVTCSKSLRITLDGNSNETVALSADARGVETSSLTPTRKILVHKAGIFRVIEIPHLGVQIKWDRFTRVYIKLDNRWKGRPQGLCGNNNKNIQDDMSTPSFGVETSPLIFGHSWKLDSSCQMPTDLYDSCADNPQRKTWSQMKCGILKSNVFKKCHAEVSVDIYHKRCVYDACACDQGGDCECLCTALSAYAHACAMMGVPIKWRTPDLCPMQCDPKCSSYSPCISACPVETCENFMQTSNKQLMCLEDSCVEGCDIKKCENQNFIYANDSFTQCQPKSDCRAPCLVVNGVTYYENEVISADNCHTCTCSRGSKLCSGVPCVATEKPQSGDQVVQDGNMKCVEGWTPWVNQDTVSGRGIKMANPNNTKTDDNEPLPTNFQIKNLNGTSYCPQTMISAIECRTVVGHKSPKATGQNVECSLERGLMCQGVCFDYEIRVLCECGDETSNVESPQKQRYPIRPGLVKQERPDETDYAHGPNGMAQYRTTLVPNQQNRPSQMGPGGYARGPDPNQQNKPTQLGPGYALGPSQTLQRTTLKPGFKDPNKLPDESSEIDPDTGLRKTTPRPKQSLNIGHPDDTDYAHGPNGMLQRTTARPLQQSKPTHLGPGGYVLGPSETLQRTTVKPGFEDPIKLPDGSSEVDPDTGLRKTTLRTFRVLGPRTTQRPRVASKPVNYLPRECSSSVPHVEHPFSCYKFLHCSPTVNNTWEYVEKTCGPSMMFNPDSMICDWDYNVIKIKQKCGVTPEVPYAQTKRPTCKDGFKFNDCASPCGYNACHFYGRYLINSGKCDQDSDECIPGCLPANALQDCVGPKVWRDSDTCVNIADCTCMTPAGVQMRPGQVIKEPCKTCQCINNDYICEETACGPTSAPPVGFAPPQPAPKQPLASCNPLVPMIEHYNNCSKYMVCTQLGNGSSFYQEQICQKTLLFNPVKLACDLPLNVIMLKPQCDNSTSSENKEPQGQLGESGVVYVIPSTVTPPLECDPEKLIPTMEKLADSAFKASSFLSAAFKPEFARLNLKPSDGSSGGWVAKINTKQEYLQVTYPKATALFGIIIQGHPMLSQYVTSFKILHSFDGQVFHPLVDSENSPQIFAGSIDQKSPVQSMFKVPIEAKVVRISPITWSGAIAMRVELLGCTQPERSKKFKKILGVTTPSPLGYLTTTILPGRTSMDLRAPVTIGPLTSENIKPVCDDPMGVENGKLQPYQIKFSSMKPLSTVANPKSKATFTDIVKLSSHKGWMPAFDTKTEFVTFDFTGLRNLTGVITKGGEYGWVKSYQVYWSKDNNIWNEMTQDNFPKTFLGNVDESAPVTNYFQYPVNAQYLKIVPSNWYHAIEMKIEPLGCFSPYPIKPVLQVLPDDEFEIVNASTCGKCPGVLESPSPVAINTCTCYPPKYWNGEECTPKAQCPCVVGHMTYNVGEHYQTENCSECLCTLNGVAKCTPKVCPACKLGNRRVFPNSCSCKCEKCPEHTVLCATSGECIPEDLWCNGVKDCADDETGCPARNEPVIKKTVIDEITITKTCPEHSCPPGFKIKPKGPGGRSPKMSSRFSDGADDEQPTNIPPRHYYIKAKYTASFEAVLPTSNVNLEENESCIQFLCVPQVDDASPDYGTGDDRRVTRCKDPFCPKGYDIKLQPVKSPKDCPQFTCEATVEKDAVCHATGRTFTTFDGTEYKYEICDHLLARDIADEKWNIVIKKNCAGGNNICTKQVVIKDKVNQHTLILLPDLTVNLDGYSFTVQQLQNANHAKFVVSKVGETLLYVSHTHGIWVIFDQFGDVKLGICARYLNQVDGLCGFYNKIQTDDKRKPTGALASTTVEFGDSWSLNKTSKEKCEPHTCPQSLQDIAWKMCNLAQHEVFKVCDKAVDINKFISRCLETACDCLLKSSNSSTSPTTAVQKQCKCSMLSGLVTECLAADDQVHLDTWRTVHDCEASCIPPLVQRDCYRRKCEPTCNTINDCPPIAATCFSGCYCPEGFVKKGSTCVKPSECRDCVCDGFGKSQYLTYDRRNFTFDGNCTYLLTRDISLADVHAFQIFATIGPCKGVITAPNKKATCTQALHIIYGPQLIHIQRGSGPNLDVLINGVKAKLPYKEKWIDVKEQGKELNILLPDSQVELNSMFETMAFNIKVPSLKFGSKMEGLCGDCNGKPTDDLQVNQIKLMDVRVNPSSAESKEKDEKQLVKEFALSWLAEEPKLQLKEERCHISEESECLPLPPETDPCFKILDDTMFGKCHIVVDPAKYVTACQQDLCKTGPTQKGACDSLAAYARECARSGICVDWRRNGFCSMECTAPFIYKSCGCTETCESIDTKEELIKSSSAVIKQDPKKLEKLKSTCNSDLGEGCFCPSGKVLSNNKCLLERECKKCDDTHFAGDNWFPDKCTECNCKNDTSIVCSKKQCPDKNTVCSIGFMPIESATEECCKKFTCVPEPAKLTSSQKCPPLVLPKCSLNQINKVFNGTDGCSKYICECIPKTQCPPIQNSTTTEKGFKTQIDSTGCCPTSKLVCDRSLCPVKPIKCDKEFYDVQIVKTANKTGCCDEFECKPPSNNCIATINGKNIMKKPDESWKTADPCLSESCAFDTNGNPIIKPLKKICNNICQAGHELQTLPNECCGNCVQTKCIVDNKLYNIGEVWTNTGDNCTKFKCESSDDNVVVSSQHETCPSIANCAPHLIYKKGCCSFCKMEALNQTNCLAETVAFNNTVNLIQTTEPGHGRCKNPVGIRGITQCAGSCKSGTKLNRATFEQMKVCECCSAKATMDLTIELVCEDGFKTTKKILVPSECSCSVQKCENQELALLKLKRAEA